MKPILMQLRGAIFAILAIAAGAGIAQVQGGGAYTPSNVAITGGTINGATIGATSASSIKGTAITGSTYSSTTNCSSAAAPAVCAAAAAGSVVIAAAGTTVTVNTTAVTANSQIFIQEDSSLSTKLSVTCNATVVRSYAVSARTATTSFVITSSAAPAATPACLSYLIVN